MKPLGWAPIHNDWCPYKRRLGCTCTEGRPSSVRTENTASSSQERPQETRPRGHHDLGLWVCRTREKKCLLSKHPVCGPSLGQLEQMIQRCGNRLRTTGPSLGLTCQCRDGAVLGVSLVTPVSSALSAPFTSVSLLILDGMSFRYSAPPNQRTPNGHMVLSHRVLGIWGQE